MDNVLAIDGPSGSGKSSVARAIAKKLGALYIDTGAMFRSIAYLFDAKGIDFHAEIPDRGLELLKFDSFRYGVDDKTLVLVEGKDVTELIRQHQISALASRVSQFAPVRDFVANWQRRVAKDHFCVLEGRDIGSVIFPQAKLKVFLTASPKVRAQRRYCELQQKNTLPKNMSLENLQKDIEARDWQDSQRAIAPLKKAEDAVVIDSSDLSVQEVIDKIVGHYHSLGESSHERSV